jgi:arsenate reductase
MNQSRLDPSVEEGLERAVSDLHAEFGAVFSLEAIAQAVAESHDSLGTYRVATYVPLLAQRFARERLRAIAATGDHIDVEPPED